MGKLEVAAANFSTFLGLFAHRARERRLHCRHSAVGRLPDWINGLENPTICLRNVSAFEAHLGSELASSSSERFRVLDTNGEAGEFSRVPTVAVVGTIDICSPRGSSEISRYYYGIISIVKV